MPISYMMTIDTEEEWDWDKGWPTKNLSLSNIESLPRFQELCDRHGVATTYFADQAVVESSHARDILLSLADRPNVEIGMHIHPWNTPPILSNGPIRTRETFLHNLPASLIQEKLASVYQCFQNAGLKPTSFRGGRFSSGSAVHEFLQDHGFLADASVCPFSTWVDEGSPDYRTRGLEPVRLPPKKLSQSALWEIPLTLAFTRRPFQLWRRWYNLVEHSWLSKLRLIGIGERLGLVRKVWLSFESPLGAHMTELLDRLQQASVDTICFIIHSSSLLPGGNSFSRTPADVERLFARADSIFRLMQDNPAFQPATVSQVAQQLEEKYHASIGHQPLR
jgi:hypothetical protein